MSKRIEVPQAEETVCIPKATFDSIFCCLEEMKNEIAALRKQLISVPKPDRLLSVAEAAEYCGVTRQTITEYRRQNKLTKVLRGARAGYLESELNKVRKKKNPQP